MLRPMGLRSFVCAWGFVCLGLFASSNNVARADLELFVAPNGDDQAAGTEDHPLATVAGAQARLRALRAEEQVDGTVSVWLLEGIYSLNEPLEFTADDNSPIGSTITYAALPGHHVVIRGGSTIKPEQLLPLESSAALPEVARQHVRVLDLTLLNTEPGQPHPARGRHRPMNPLPLELFAGDRRLAVACWPNDGWAHVKSVGPASTSWPVPHELTPDQKPSGMMAHGFWMHDWQDSCEPVTIAPQADGQLVFQIDAAHAAHVGKIREGARYRIENLLSQLDQPGEWYWDHRANRAYVWATDQMLRDGLFVSTVDTPISLYDVNNVTFRGITIEGAQACCVEIAGGEHVCLDNCLIRHAGNLGVNIYHGSKHRIINCEITSTGAGAIRVDGGERETLTACDHVIENCRLHDYAQLHLAYRPGVNVYGVGVSVLGNEIYNAPHAAVILHGNEHRVERNHVHHVCQATDDVGAIYLGHNPTYRGNKINHNHLHDLGGYSRLGVIGIYLDDFASGTEVTHNVLERAGRGVAIGGGRDNTIDNNLFIDCLAAVQIDNRGTTWAKNFVVGPDSYFAKCCSEVDVQQGAFAERYPELSTLMTNQPEQAGGNRVTRNLFEGAIGIDLHDGLDDRTVLVDSNLSEARSLLTNVNQGDYRPRAHSRAEQIDFELVGPGKVVYVAK